MAKKRRLITRRRLKWLGVYATACLGAALVASYWYWPSYSWARANSSAAWGVNVEPCGISVDRTGVGIGRSYVFIPGSVFAEGWRFRSRLPVPSNDEVLAGAWIQVPPAFVWLPTYDSVYLPGSYEWQRVKIPLWLPLLLIAAPTAWLWRTDRRVKPWQCESCRYDLRGLEPKTVSSESRPTICPECGTTKKP